MSIVAQMQKIFVQKRGEISDEELLDLTGVARSLPGVMVGNTAMLYGYHAGGVLGGFAAVVGLSIPPLMMLSVITLFYEAFRANPWVDAAMMGIRAAVVPIIVCALLSMWKGSFTYAPCFGVMAVALVLYLLGVNCIWLMVFGAVCGIGISEFYERRGTKK